MRDSADQVYTVHRHAASDNFTIIPNAVLQGRGMTALAMAIHHHMLSKPSTWRFSVAYLVAAMNPTGPDGQPAPLRGQGEKGIRAALRELEEFGFVKTEQQRGKGALWARSEIHVYDEPQGFAVRRLQAPYGSQKDAPADTRRGRGTRRRAEEGAPEAARAKDPDEEQSPSSEPSDEVRLTVESEAYAAISLSEPSFAAQNPSSEPFAQNRLTVDTETYSTFTGSPCVYPRHAVNGRLIKKEEIQKEPPNPPAPNPPPDPRPRRAEARAEGKGSAGSARPAGSTPTRPPPSRSCARSASSAWAGTSGGRRRGSSPAAWMQAGRGRRS